MASPLIKKGVINLPPRDKYGQFTLNLNISSEVVNKKVKF